MGCLASMNFDCIMTGWVGEEKYEVVVGAMVTVSCPVHWWWYAWFWTSNLKCKWQITWTLTAAENTSVLNFQKLNYVHAWPSILCSYTRASVASSVGKSTSEEPGSNPRFLWVMWPYMVVNVCHVTFWVMWPYMVVNVWVMWPHTSALLCTSDTGYMLMVQEA